MEELIRKYALLNAYEYGGEADIGSVIGKVIQERPELKEDIDTLKQDTADVVGDVNELSADEQRDELEAIAPELLEYEEDERDLFAQFPTDTPATTAFPPEPSKHPHIGHAKSLFVNSEYARRTDGTFILRFEDTNPSTVEEEYYKSHLDLYEWLGVSFDTVTRASEYMEEFYTYCERLIEQGDAYVSHASAEEIQETRRTGEPTEYRDKSVEDNMDDWHAMLAGDQDGVVRAKIDLEHRNSTMRDPTLFRVNEDEHPKTGRKYRVWPTYDFQNAVLDALQGITLRFRTKEFEMRSELQRYLQERLDLTVTETYEFARFEMEGVETSGRVIREKLESGELLGWDDPSLATLAALRRRGFQPEAIKQFVLTTGLSKTESTVTWDDLIVENRRVLDETAPRYFFIEDPVEVRIEGAPQRTVELERVPGGDDLRSLEVGDRFYMERDDYEALEDGKMYRFMHCCNFIKKDETLEFHSVSHEEFEGLDILHFLPVQHATEASVLHPDKEVTEGLAEDTVEELEEGDVIQFTRKYFCRLDDGEQQRYWFTHR